MVNENGEVGAEKEQSDYASEGDHPDLASKSPLLEKEGSDDEATGNSNSKLELASSPTILYCGNFGNMHDSATLFDYWRQVASMDFSDPRVSAFQSFSVSAFPQWLFHCSSY